MLESLLLVTIAAQYLLHDNKRLVVMDRVDPSPVVLLPEGFVHRRVVRVRRRRVVSFLRADIASR